MFSSDSVVKEYSLNGKDWFAYDSGVEFTDNGKVYFRGQDAAGNYSSVVEYNVSNIDKDAPTLEITGNVTSWTNQDVLLCAKASDGKIEYFNGTTWEEKSSITATQNGTYTFRVTDAAGNVTEKSVTVDTIDKVAPVLTISGNPTEWTNKDAAITAAAADAAGNGATVMYKKDTDTGFIQYPGSIGENGTYLK